MLSKGLPGPHPRIANGGSIGEILLKKNTNDKASSGGWGESDDAVLQTWTESPPKGVDGEETSCLFEPEFQSRGANRRDKHSA